MSYLLKVGLNTRKQKKKQVIAKIGKKLTSKRNVFENEIAKENLLLKKTIWKSLLIIKLLNDTYKNSNTYPIFNQTYENVTKVCKIFI